MDITNSSEVASVAALMDDPSTSAGVGGNLASSIDCYSHSMISMRGIWRGDNPLDFTVPLFLLQSMLVVMVTRGLNVVFHRLRQPRFAAEVIGGIVMGPSVMGRIIPDYMNVVFPPRSQAVLETVADLGLLYFIFLVGLQVNLGALNRAGKKVWAITAGSIVFPFVVEILAFFLFGGEVLEKNYKDSYLVFLGVSISVTAYPVLTRILAEVKLLNTDVGRLSMSAAILTDGVAWVLLAIAIAMTGQKSSIMASIALVVSGTLFVMFMYCFIRPAILWAMARTSANGEPINTTLAQFLMIGVMVSGIVADSVGIHAVFGAFIFGVMIPNGPIVSFLTEKMDDFVTGILLPLFFAVVGIRVELASLVNPGVYGFLIIVVVFSGIAKVGATCMVSQLFGMTRRDGFTLGVLMNTKGIMELIVLHIALHKKVLYIQSYTTMILMSVIMTTLVTPLTLLLCYQQRQSTTIRKRRMIQQIKPDAELRVLACIHNIRNIPSIINLLEVSNPTKHTPIFAAHAHLIELTGRTSAMLVVHDAHEGSIRRSYEEGSGSTSGSSFKSGSGTMVRGSLNKIQAQCDHILKSFESYGQHKGGVTVKPHTIVSPYYTMHEDVWDVVEDEDVAFLILPFHKQNMVDGRLEETNVNPGIRTFNQNALLDPPCSVGVLVDRGIGSTTKSYFGPPTDHIVVIFIGGPDDREALAYAARVVERPTMNLLLIRFIDSNEVMSNEKQEERYFDDVCLRDFSRKTRNNELVVYTEKVVTRGDELMTVIRGIDAVYDLYVVGRGENVMSELLVGMSEWTENPELGPIGDWLASQDFSATVSVLVIQQYMGVVFGSRREGLSESTPASPVFDRQRRQPFDTADCRQSVRGWV